jgi:uncharacterized protein
VHTQYRPLRLNVGFLLSQTAGYGREFDFHEEKMTLGGDFHVEKFVGRILLNRTAQGIVAKGDFSTFLPADCARCLKPFSSPISIHLEDLFVYPPQYATDPLLTVGEDAHLNLEPLLREYLLINQPTRPLCRPDCKGLCPICGNDLNEGECHHPEEVQAPALLSERVLGQSDTSKAIALILTDASISKPAKEKKAPAPSGKAPAAKSKKVAAKKAPPKKKTGGKKASAAKASGGPKKKPTKKKA